ncbi:Peptidyl-prolyl cis-trans isomerase OS=Streptomyces glaucescens OX=1907 GN=SGLAU_06085 PE=3 SV=1 [Streptomyces glaucescens]
MLQAVTRPAPAPGGPGYTIPDQNLKDKSLKDNVYPAGTVAMANTGQKAQLAAASSSWSTRTKPVSRPATHRSVPSQVGMKVLKKIADAGGHRDG